MFKTRFFLFILIALAGINNVFAQSCDGENAKAVKVILDGCGGSEPSGAFNVEYGSDTIRVEEVKGTPQRPQDHYWLWTAQTSAMQFKIGTRSLSIPADSMSRALSRCKTPAVPVRDGACMALYVVKCEPLWFVNVAMVPIDKAPSLTYERQGNGKTIDACERDKPPTGPGEVDLAHSESLLVRIDKPECNIPLSLRSFKRKLELQLADVQVNLVVPGGAIKTSGATDDTGREVLLKRVKEMKFTKKD
jgi:hypothetical protein